MSRRIAHWILAFARMTGEGRLRVQELIPTAREIVVVVHHGVPDANPRHAVEIRSALADLALAHADVAERIGQVRPRRLAFVPIVPLRLAQERAGAVARGDVVALPA